MYNCFKQNKIVFIFALSFLLLYAGFVFFMRTPWYTAAQLKLAYKNNNTAALSRVIDMPSVVSNGYDDVTGDLFTYNKNIPPSVKQLFEQFYKLIKKPVCDGTLNIIDNYLATGIWSKPSGTSLLKGRDLGIDYNELLVWSMLRSTTVKKIGSLSRDESGNYILPLTVTDKYTGTNFVLNLLLQKNTDGVWQITKIVNYHDYLVHVHDLCETDIDSYIKDTKAKNTEYNNKFKSLQTQFQNITKNIGSDISKDKRSQMQKFIVNNIIPAYRAYEDYLQNVDVPSGALHLHTLRLNSTSKTIESWQSFAKGIEDNSAAELAEAEKAHQDSLDLEQKVSDIINKMPALFVPDIP